MNDAKHLTICLSMYIYPQIPNFYGLNYLKFIISLRITIPKVNKQRAKLCYLWVFILLLGKQDMVQCTRECRPIFGKCKLTL